MKECPPYDEASKTFSPAQVAQIKAIETDYTKTIEPDMEIMDMGSRMEACRKIREMPPEFGPLFIKYRDYKNMEQESMWATFRRDEFPKIDFLDHEILKKHLVYTQMLQIQIGYGMFKLAMEGNKPTPPVCKAVREELRKFVKDNGLE